MSLPYGRAVTQLPGRLRVGLSRAELRLGLGVLVLTLALITSGCSSSSAANSPTATAGTSPASAPSGAAGSASRTNVSVAPVSPSRAGTKPAGTKTTGTGATGNVSQIVPARRQPTKAPVALTRTADFGRGVTLRLTALTAVKVRARTPGEFSGPALKLTFSIYNGGTSAIDLTGFVATVTDSRGMPATPVTAPPAAPFRGSLPAGRSARGVYVSTVATSRRHPVVVSASYTAAAPVVLFRGNTK